MQVLANGKLSKEEQAKKLNDIIKAMENMKAFTLWVDLIRETDDREEIGTALETLESILPGTKTSLRDAHYKSLLDVTEKCVVMGLL